MLSRNQKYTRDSQKPKIKELKRNKKENHQTTKGIAKRRNEHRTTKTTGNKN